MLPDGTVLITGGTSGGGFVDINPGDAARSAELWDPKNPTQWTTLAANSVMRVYHSVSLLLPDGTVLHGASGNAWRSRPGAGREQPRDLLAAVSVQGRAPAITTVAETVTYDADLLRDATPNAAQVTDVRWIRLGSVTHAFDQGSAPTR